MQDNEEGVCRMYFRDKTLNSMEEETKERRNYKRKDKMFPLRSCGNEAMTRESVAGNLYTPGILMFCTACGTVFY